MNEITEKAKNIVNFGLHRVFDKLQDNENPLEWIEVDDKLKASSLWQDASAENLDNIV